MEKRLYLYKLGETLENRYFIINGTLLKNPTKDDFKDVPRQNIIEICKGDFDDVVIETWWINPIESGKTIDFAYSFYSMMHDSFVSRFEAREAHGRRYFEHEPGLR